MTVKSLSALLLVASAMGAPLAAAEGPRKSKKMIAVPYTGTRATDRVAVPAPTVTVSGKVLMKDGITPVGDAELVFTSTVDEQVRKVRTQGSGKYKIGLPVGQHALQIDNRMAVYKSPSTYRVVNGSNLEIDFLLVPDFEHEENGVNGVNGANGANGVNGVPKPATRHRGPDPRPEAPVVVGTVADMVQPEGGARRGWKELLGFLTGILAVAVAAD